MQLQIIAQYIKEMTKAYNELLSQNKKPNESLYGLINLEKVFVDELIKSNKAHLALKRLLHFIHTEKDMRSIRIYFRERESVFDEKFKKIIETENYDALLKKYHLNFLFCDFVVKNLTVNKKLGAIFQKMKKLRDETVTFYLHYTLNRAKVFLRYANNILSFDDLVGAASEGLVIAVDKYKYNPESPTPFHMVAIGRMVSSLIALQASSTPVKLSYRPARQLYTIRRLMDANPNISYAELGRAVGMTEGEVTELLHALHLVSLDDVIVDSSGDENNTFLQCLLPSLNHNSIYESIENRDLLVKAYAYFYKKLDLLQQKVLQLRGVSIHHYIDFQSYWPDVLRALSDME